MSGLSENVEALVIQAKRDILSDVNAAKGGVNARFDTISADVAKNYDPEQLVRWNAWLAKQEIPSKFAHMFNR